MTFIIHWTIMASVFFVGLICFTCYSFYQDFFLATIILTLSMLFINLYGFLTRALPQRALFYLFSLLFLLVAISVFGNYGIEQRPVGYQTLYFFHVDGVAISLMLFLLSSLLLVLGINQNINIVIQPRRQKTIKAPELKQGPIIKSDNWEEASIEDVQSGKYQAL